MDPRCIPLYETDIKLINRQILIMRIFQSLGIVIGIPILFFSVSEYFHGRSSLKISEYYKPICGLFFSSTGLFSLPQVYKLKREGSSKEIFLEYYRTYSKITDEELKESMRKECMKMIEERQEQLEQAK